MLLVGSEEIDLLGFRELLENTEITKKERSKFDIQEQVEQQSIDSNAERTIQQTHWGGQSRIRIDRAKVQKKVC